MSLALRLVTRYVQLCVTRALARAVTLLRHAAFHNEHNDR